MDSANWTLGYKKNGMKLETGYIWVELGAVGVLENAFMKSSKINEGNDGEKNMKGWKGREGKE